MYAVIQTGGKQYKVEKGSIIEIEKLHTPKTNEITFKEVLLCADKKDCSVGDPYVKGAKVVAELMDETRSKKIVTYKYKRRKSYHRTIGHRQDLLRVRIKEVAVKKD